MKKTRKTTVRAAASAGRTGTATLGRKLEALKRILREMNSALVA